MKCVVFTVFFVFFSGCNDKVTKPPTTNSATLAWMQQQIARNRVREAELEALDAAMAQAIRNSHEERIYQLLDMGADLTAALRLSVRSGNVLLCNQFIGRGANVNDGAHDGHPILAQAVGDADVFDLLLNEGADATSRVKWKGSTGFPAIGNNSSILHWAAAYGVPSVVARLLNLSLDVDDQNDDGQTPLHVAAEFGNGSIVELLLNQGADTEIRNVVGNRAKDNLCVMRENPWADELTDDELKAVRLLGGSIPLMSRLRANED